MNAFSSTVLSPAGKEFASSSIRGRKADFFAKMNWSLRALHRNAAHQLDFLPLAPGKGMQ